MGWWLGARWLGVSQHSLRDVGQSDSRTVPTMDSLICLSKVNTTCNVGLSDCQTVPTLVSWTVDSPNVG